MPPVDSFRTESRFHADAGELSEVRAMVREIPDEVRDDACLLLTELFTNSVRHSGIHPDELIRVVVNWTDSSLRVDVFDVPHAKLFPRLPVRRPATGAASGWGLYLVDRLATKWGCSLGHCWFEMSPVAVAPA